MISATRPRPGNEESIAAVTRGLLDGDASGASRISMEDLAVALIDEAERPRHHRQRFTVAY